jgi:hypothetical protein
MREGEELEKIETELAKRRKVATQNNNAGRAEVAKLPQLIEKGKTRDKVASAIGVGGARTYDKAKVVYQAAQTGNKVAVAGLWRDFPCSVAAGGSITDLPAALRTHAGGGVEDSVSGRGLCLSAICAGCLSREQDWNVPIAVL